MIVSADYLSSTRNAAMPEEIVVEDQPGHCWRCRQPFVPGELITVVPGRFLHVSRDGQTRRYPLRRGTMCPRCTTEEELESAPRRVKCEGCGQPLATIATDLPGDLRRVCSN